MSREKLYKVIIETRGQAGAIIYTEASDSLRCDWEYGAYDIIAIVWATLPVDWDSTYPWAKGRKQEIIRRIADEVIKQNAPNCWVEYQRIKYIKVTAVTSNSLEIVKWTLSILKQRFISP